MVFDPHVSVRGQQGQLSSENVIFGASDFTSLDQRIQNGGEGQYPIFWPVDGCWRQSG
jgi:hypothetical protein